MTKDQAKQIALDWLRDKHPKTAGYVTAVNFLDDIAFVTCFVAQRHYVLKVAESALEAWRIGAGESP